MSHVRFPLLAAGLLVSLAAPSATWAQNNPGYFIPPAGRPQQQQQHAPAGRPAPARRPSPTQAQGPVVQPVAPPPPNTPTAEEPQGPQLQLQLPPAPTLSALGKGQAPPAAVIGVLGIPEIMRASTAAQLVEKVIGERREKLNADAQKEQLTWREMQQSLAGERSKLNPDQIRAREKELQDRITNAQRTFRDRNRIIQEAGQYGLAQIERTLVQVIRQVAESRGMNLVLHRAQVALNVNEFDITDQVAEQMNKVMPSVQLPADGVEPPKVAAVAPANPTPEPGSTPANAPAAQEAPASGGQPGKK